MRASNTRRPLWLAFALSGLLCLPAAAQAPQPPAALPAPLPLFPPDNWWNADISAAPLDPSSAEFHQLHRRHDVAPSRLRG